MQVSRFRNREEYLAYKVSNAEALNANWAREKVLSEKNRNKTFTLRGFSYPAEKMVDFKIDYLYSDGKDINWRERVICPITGLNNRLRASIHMIDFELGLRPYQTIYIAEQVTPLYTFLKKKFPDLIGSEYLGYAIAPGHVGNNQVRHETATQLSFADHSLDAYLSFECFEHIPDFKKSFAEAGRVLKKAGKFLWSVPFADGEYNNIIRATVNDEGQVQHILEPEYHGDPVSDKGILCFTHFGWQMLDQVKEAGFRDAYALVFRSDIFGYLGNEQMLFVADKS